MRRVERRLAHFFLRNGYTRAANLDMRKERGKMYHKGYEVRFVLGSTDEVSEVEKLILDAGLRPGKVFVKNTQYVQPVYGRDAVLKIVSWADEESKRLRTARR